MKVASLADGRGPVMVWDPSVRVLHWSLAASTVAAVATGFAGTALFGLHRACGALVLGLSATRLLLGFTGSTTARFGEFVRGPTEVWRYVRSLAQASHRRHFGHNPLGAVMVLSMLGCILVQATLGLFASDGVADEGPLALRIDGRLAEAIGALHGRIALAITVLVCLHVGAVVAYRLVWSVDLIGPMITGRAPRDSFVSIPEKWRPGPAAWKVLLVGATSVGAVAAIIV